MRSYAGIPHPDRPGLFVMENALLLRRYAYVEQRLFTLLSGHFPGTAIWELKHALARHAWEDAQHADALRRRVVTMRTSPHLLEECPDPALAALMDEVEAATDSVELAAGVHGLLKPALLAAYQWHLATTNPVADFPTVRELEIIVREETAQLAWSAEALAELAGPRAAEAAIRAAATHDTPAQHPTAGPDPAEPPYHAVAPRAHVGGTRTQPAREEAGDAHGIAGPAGASAATDVAAQNSPPAPTASEGTGGDAPAFAPRVPDGGTRGSERAGLPGCAQAGPPIGTPQSPEPDAEARALAWQAHLSTFLRAAGGITGRQPRGTAEPPRAQARFRVSRHPQRDGRFLINFQFNEPGDPPATTVPEKLIFMMRGRLNELAATENPASAIFELSVAGTAWEVLLDLARHMWDEARHSMLGQAVIESLGRDIREWPLRIGPGYAYLSVTAWERYAHLGINVEQSMMKYPPGKRQEYEWCRDVARYPLAAMYQDYDWSDEVYHTQIARRLVGRWLGAGGRAAASDGDAAGAGAKASVGAAAGAEAAAGAGAEAPAGAEQMRAFAAAAADAMARRTAQIAALWREKRARGETLRAGDPLPPEVEAVGRGETPGAGGTTDADGAGAPGAGGTSAGAPAAPADVAALQEYAQPEMTLTRAEVEEDLRHAE